MAKLACFVPILTLTLTIPVHCTVNARSDHRQKDAVFKLEVPLEFKGRVVSGALRKSEIPALLNTPVRNGDTDPVHLYGVEMTTPSGYKVEVYTCQEWLTARQNKDYSATTYDMAMEGYLIRTCGLLYALRRAQTPAKSFIDRPRVTLADLNLLPAEILSYMPDDGGDSLHGKTVAQVVGSKDIEKDNANELDLSFGGFQQWFSEVVRADFNGDGIEDIFVFTGGQAEGGTMGYSDYLVLTRTQPFGPLRMIGPQSDPLKADRKTTP